MIYLRIDAKNWKDKICNSLRLSKFISKKEGERERTCRDVHVAGWDKLRHLQAHQVLETYAHILPKPHTGCKFLP